MKIGIVISEQTPDAGGGFTFEAGLIEAIQRLHAETPHELVMIGKPLQPPASLAGMPYLSLKTVRPKEAKLVREVKRIWRKLKPGRRDDFLLDYERAPQLAAANLDLIVYLNPYFSPYLDLPFVMNVWDVAHRLTPFFPEMSLGAAWDYREAFCRERLQRASYVVCPNAVAKQEIVDFFQVPPERIRTLRHPTPADALREMKAPTADVSLAPLGITGDFLLFPAQFWPHKNHVLLLRMLRVLKAKYDYAPQLVLSGSDKPVHAAALEGNLAHVKQCARELGLEAQVIFPGFIARELLIALYRKAAALVFPPFLGPENLPPLEAFALGCPVIASEIAGAREQFGDAAVLLDPKSPEAWADAVQKFRRDADFRERQIAKGKVRAAQFTADDFIRGLFAIFAEFEPYRCNWTSAVAGLPADLTRVVTIPKRETRHARPRP
jgi:glycosyltransferase involved in cell wall biosynthesis